MRGGLCWFGLGFNFKRWWVFLNGLSVASLVRLADRPQLPLTSRGAEELQRLAGPGLHDCSAPALEDLCPLLFPLVGRVPLHPLQPIPRPEPNPPELIVSSQPILPPLPVSRSEVWAGFTGEAMRCPSPSWVEGKKGEGDGAVGKPHGALGVSASW